MIRQDISTQDPQDISNKKPCLYKILVLLYVFALVGLVVGILLLYGVRSSRDKYIESTNNGGCFQYCGPDQSSYLINNRCCNYYQTKCQTKQQCYDDYMTKFTRGIVISGLMIGLSSAYILLWTIWRCYRNSNAIDRMIANQRAPLIGNI